MEKRLLEWQEKVKKTSQPKKAPKSLGFIDDLLPLLGWLEEEVFIRGPYEGYELSYIATHDTKYLKWVLKMSGQHMSRKDLMDQALAKT